MTIFKWTHCPVRLLFSFVLSSNIVCFFICSNNRCFLVLSNAVLINCGVGSPRKYFIFGLLARKGNVATKSTVIQCFAFPAHSGSLLLSGSISCSVTVTFMVHSESTLKKKLKLLWKKVKMKGYFLKFLLAFIAQWTQFLHFTEFWMMEVVHEEASGEETR